MSLILPEPVTQLDLPEIEPEGEASSDEIANQIIHADRLRFQAYEAGAEDITTSATSSEDILETIIWENILSEDRDILHFEYWGSFAANANQKIFNVEWAATGLVECLDSSQNGGAWGIIGRAFRQDSATLRIVGMGFDAGQNQPFYAEKTVSFSSEINFALQCRTPSQAGDMTVRAYRLAIEKRDALWVLDSNGFRVTTNAGNFVVV